MRAIIVFFFCLSFLMSNAQLPSGAPAPNITVNDINGNPFSLYSHTSAGKGVVLDFFATWCGPCWSFHNSGTLNQVNNNLGAIASVVALEADSRTNTGCIINSGCNFSTLGNWATVPYPIADLNPTNGPIVAAQYQINYFPTLYVISHDNRAFELRSKSYVILRNWLQESFFLDANPVVGNASCGDDGFITLNRIKGYGSISYNWSNGATTEDLNNIGAGTYSVTVEDQNGYDKVFGPFVINGPADPLELNVDIKEDVNCFGENNGYAEVSASGGNSGYQFQWSHGATGPIASNLPAGQYNVSVIDSKGCMKVKNVLIDQPAILNAAGNTTAEKCGWSDGQIFVNVTGGSRPYTYDMGEGPTSSSTFKGLEAGHYSIEVRDRNGCTTIYDATVNSIDGPESFAGVDLGMDCAISELSLSGSGSQGRDIVYQWRTPDGEILTSVDQLNIKVGLPGTYILRVEDESSGCYTDDTLTVNDLRDYPELHLQGHDTINCIHDEFWLEVDEEEHVIYSWSTQDGEILSNEDSTQIQIALGGWYYASALDSISSCQSLDSFFVVEDHQQPEFELSGAKFQACPDEELRLEVVELDSSRNYELQWHTNNGKIVGDMDKVNCLVNQPGDYNLDVLDLGNGCMSSMTWTVENRWNIAEANFETVSDALTIHFSDHSLGERLTWFWDFGDDRTSTEQNPSHEYQSEGTYQVCLTVENECGSHDICQEVEVSEQRAPLQVVNAELDHVQCHGGSNGSIDLDIVGGYPPYEISWSNGDYGESISDLEAGYFEANIKDSQGEEIVETYEILEPSAIFLQDVVYLPDHSSGDGSIELFVSGGIGQYTYLWSDGSTENPAINLTAGFYECEVTDQNGCTEHFGPFEVQLSVAVDDNEQLGFNIFPNPGREVIYLVSEEEIAYVKIYNMLGAFHRESKYTGEIDIRGLEPGTYLIEIESVYGSKAVKQWIKK